MKEMRAQLGKKPKAKDIDEYSDDEDIFNQEGENSENTMLQPEFLDLVVEDIENNMKYSARSLAKIDEWLVKLTNDGLKDIRRNTLLPPLVHTSSENEKSKR